MRIKLFVVVIAAVLLIVGANPARAEDEGHGRIEFSNQSRKSIDISIVLGPGQWVNRKLDPTNDYTYEKTDKSIKLTEFSAQRTSELNPKCIKKFDVDKRPTEFNYRVKVSEAPEGQEKLGITCEITGSTEGSPQGVF